MKRRHFITSASLAIPVIATGILGCKMPVKNATESEFSIPGMPDDPLISKAMLAMLSMQRMAWEQGTASQALIALGRSDLAVLFARDALVRQTAEGRLGILGNDPGVTDPASNGEAVLLAWKETGEDKYRKAADAQYEYLKNKAPKTSDGILHHVTYARQVWSDASFMAPPFLALMGDYDEAVKQIEGFRKYLIDPDKKLYYHIWDEDKNEYTRKLFWGGGNGWTAAGIAKIIRLLQENREDLRNRMISCGKEVIDGCLAYMRSDGLFHDIIDDPESFIETNLGQMLAFAIYTGVKSGWLDMSYKEKADIMRQAARSKVDDHGIVQGACGSPGFDKVGTSTEAQSFFLMMESAFHSL
ncbi:MAG TPA: glycoside hydrolase family 88 protein [Bacteroidales bacterium]|nr:glycoside hydrolase family 88 protein [Bacteroidales bacterium]